MWSMNEVRVSYLSPASMLQMLLIRFWIHSILKESRNKVRDFVLVWRANLWLMGNSKDGVKWKKEETDQVMGHTTYYSTYNFCSI